MQTELQTALATIAALSLKLETIERAEARNEKRAASPRVTAKRGKLTDAEKARKAKFKLEAWKRNHLHSSLNRYHC